VEAGGELRIYYDPLIPFRGARVCQTTSIDVDPGARLHFWEGLMAGRIGRGEIWQFDEFSSETRLRVNGQLLYLDRFRLAQNQDPANSEWRMGNARYLATGLCFDEHASRFAERLHQRLPGAGIGIDVPAPGLAVVRIVAVHGPEFHRYRSVFASLAHEFEM
jgi:urease accessory protein